MPHNSPHAPLKRLIVATGNVGKLREFGALLAGLPYALESQSALGILPVEETGTTFLANAVLKARHAAQISGAAALADDSGIEVDALAGEPGIYSARYAGPQADDAANNAKLLAALADVPREQRRARYRCALVFVDGPGDPSPVTAEGVWEGTLLEAPQGTGGFGYDPYFWVAEFGMTAAQMDPVDKNRVSHRGRALRSLRAQLAARSPVRS